VMREVKGRCQAPLPGVLKSSRACTHERAGNVGFRGNSGRGLGIALMTQLGHEATLFIAMHATRDA